MAINFPSTSGQPTDGSFTHTHGDRTWSWNGESWVSFIESISSITDGISSVSFDVNNTLDIDTNIKIHGVQELFSSESGSIAAASTVDFDTSISYIHRLTGSISGDFSANIANLNLANNYATNVSIVIEQGATPYVINALEIDSASQTIEWAGGTQPTGNANKTDILSFTIFNTGSGYKVLGQLTTFG